MNKVILTGMVNGALRDSCAPCNFNFQHLISNLSMALWVDKMVVSQKVYQLISDGFPDKYTARIIKMIIDYYQDNNAIDLLDTTTIYNKDVSKLVETISILDLAQLQAKSGREYNHSADKDGKKDSTVLECNGNEYCFPKLVAINGDLLLAKLTNSSCMFDDYESEFCKQKFSLFQDKIYCDRSKIDSMEKIISSFLPDIHTLPKYIDNHYRETTCFECGDIERCERDYLKMLEVNLKQYFSWKDYDEFHQLRALLNQIIKNRDSTQSEYTAENIYEDYLNEKNRINVLIHRRLPKISRWVNLITSISVPIDLIALSTGNIPTSLAASITAGASTLLTNQITRIQDKHKWINFSLK